MRGVQSTYRCLAFHRLGGAVALQCRQRKSLTAYFPDVTATVLEQLPPGTVLDGELVIYHDGRCDFAALHQRLTRPAHPATTASYVIFDLLAVAGRDLRGLPYRKCRERLRRLCATAGPPLALMPAPRDLAGAHTWMRDYVAAGGRGGGQALRARLPAAASVLVSKVRARTTADAVGGVIGPLDAPEATAVLTNRGVPEPQILAPTVAHRRRATAPVPAMPKAAPATGCLVFALPINRIAPSRHQSE